MALEVPAIVARKRGAQAEPRPKPEPANDDRKPSPPPATRSAIVTARRPKARASIPPGLLPDTEAEAKRRADLANAMFQEMKRQIAAKIVKDRT